MTDFAADDYTALWEQQADAVREQFRHYRPLMDAADEFVNEAQDGRRVFTGMRELDEQMRGIGAGHLLLLQGYSHNGKCVALDTIFTMANGLRVLAKEIRVGDRVQGLNGPETVEAVEDNGVHPIVQIETHCGLTLRVTEEHPVLTEGGWVEARNITPDMRLIGEPAWLDDDDDDDAPLSLLEARFLGHLTGDGSLSNPSSLAFTNADHGVLDSVSHCLAQHGAELVRRSKYDYTIRAIRHEGHNPTYVAWLRDKGISFTTSHHKRVPASVMTGGRRAALGFLAGLLDTDGSVEAGQLLWYSVSRGLLEDCQALLARLGYRAKLTAKKGRYKGEEHLSWRLSLPLKEGSADLFPQLPLASHKRFEKVEWLRKSGPRKDAPLTVKSVLVTPPEPTLAVQVSGSHTHVTNGIVTHNTQVWLHMLRHNKHKRFVLFTPDEPTTLVLAKLASIEHNVDAKELERQVAQDDRDAVRLLHETIEQYPNLIVFDQPMSALEIEDAYDEACDVWGAAPDLVTFDYLQQLRVADTVPGQADWVKGFGKQRNVPLCVLHQTSRSAGANGQELTIDSGAFGGEQQATFVVGVRRKKFALMDAIREQREKLQRAQQGQTIESCRKRIEELQRDLREHEYTLTVNMSKNKRPGGGLVGEVDYEIETSTGRLIPLAPGDLPRQYRAQLVQDKRAQRGLSVVHSDNPNDYKAKEMF